jgi:hypothetical protein
VMSSVRRRRVRAKSANASVSVSTSFPRPHPKHSRITYLPRHARRVGVLCCAPLCRVAGLETGRMLPRPTRPPLRRTNRAAERVVLGANAPR